jgi:hypothetical protein
VSGFQPVATVTELNSLDETDMIAGHLSAERGDPEPGPNRGKAFWHGWRTRMMDLHEIPIDEKHRKLVKEWIASTRSAAK